MEKMKSFMKRRNIHANFVQKSSPIFLIYNDTREYIQVKILIHVAFVTKNSLSSKIEINTKELTQVKDLMLVSFVTRNSLRGKIKRYMKEFTQEKNLKSVGFVTRNSVRNIVENFMKDIILMKSLILNVEDEGKIPLDHKYKIYGKDKIEVDSKNDKKLTKKCTGNPLI